MPRVRTRRYEQYGISKYRFLELKSIALQYDQMVAEEKKLRRGEIDRKPGGNRAWRKPDPTGNAAIGIALRSNAHRIRAIEECARIAAPGFAAQLMECVARGVPYERISPTPPCGRAQFYAARRLFFCELDRRIE